MFIGLVIVIVLFAAFMMLRRRRRPHQLTAGGRKAHVVWFRHMNMNTVMLTMADRPERLQLELAVPAHYRTPHLQE
jgi:hypothetical protein